MKNSTKYLLDPWKAAKKMKKNRGQWVVLDKGPRYRLAQRAQSWRVRPPRALLLDHYEFRIQITRKGKLIARSSEQTVKLLGRAL